MIKLLKVEQAHKVDEIDRIVQMAFRQIDEMDVTKYSKLTKTDKINKRDEIEKSTSVKL